MFSILNLIVTNLSGESNADFYYFGKNIHDEIENAIMVCHEEIVEKAKNAVISATAVQSAKKRQIQDAVGSFSAHSVRERIEYEYEKQFYAVQNKPVHGTTIRFTLSKKSVRKLYSLRGIPIEKLMGTLDERLLDTDRQPVDKNLCYRTVTKYLSRLFEAYASLSIRERERVVFSDYYKLIESVIKNSKDQKVCLSAVVSVGNESKVLIIKPYSIMEDIYTGYCYLIGYARDAHSNEDFTIGSFRISRFVSVQEYKGIVPLSQTEIDQIRKRLENVSPAFIRSRAVDVKVKLNPRGQTLINTILHNRPRIKQIERNNDGTAIYTFYCTEFNAFNYFMPFGENAVIISPSSLKQRLYSEFVNAINAYS